MMKVPFLSFDATNEIIREEIFETFEKFYDSKYYVLGPNTTTFEEQFANYCGTKHCRGISNGLDALHLSLKALNIGKGDEVIVPSNTYIASVLAVSMIHATPVLVEPDINTFNIDKNLIEAAITEKTKAILPVHLYGQPCEMDVIMDLADRYDLKVIEDNAQSQGATFKGQKTGSIGHINATSFYPTKNLGALGEAGAITTNDPILDEMVRSLRNYGSEKRYHNEYQGYNNRIDELQAGILSVKLKYLDLWTTERQALAANYDRELANVRGLQLPFIAEGATHVYHLYVIRTSQRDALAAYLKENNIDTIIHYPIPPHLQKAYKDMGSKKGAYPIAEQLSQEVLSIPLFIGMTEEQQKYICDKIRQFYK